MDKRIIFAVAGSGKTSYLISELNKEERFLLITYTNNNLDNLRNGVIKKFGYMPDNIKIFSYFTFLYSFCYKPFLHQKIKAKGLSYKENGNRFIKKNNIAHYVDSNKRLYSNRLSKLLLVKGQAENIKLRISKYFDYLLIDEVQDLGGNDFNLLKSIATTEVNHIYVGDFFQHTFDTSRDGNTNKNLHNNYDSYMKEFEKMGLSIDKATLLKSYRCSPVVCRFISDKLKIEIESNNRLETKIEFISEQNKVVEVLNDSNIIKLFYQEHHKYPYYSKNWGASKGDDKYHDICIILNKATLAIYKKRKLNKLAPSTKNKLYVALSRARNNVYLIPHTLLPPKNNP